MGRPNLSCETKFSGAKTKEKSPCSADHDEQDWQPKPIDPYCAESADYTYIVYIIHI